jgi:hypothetical protein
LNQYGGSIADTNFCFGEGLPDINQPTVIRWLIPPARITHSMLDPQSDSSFSYTFIIGAGSQGGERTRYLELSRYIGGLWGPPSVFTFYAGCSYTFTMAAAPGELPGIVDFDFCDRNYEELPERYVVDLQDTLYMRVLCSDPDAYLFRLVRLVTDQVFDTVYTVLSDSISEYERRGWVFSAKTLGDSVSHAQGFATIHGFVMKGDTIAGEDYVDAGRLMIHVDGCSPYTAYSFVSTDKFTFTAYFRSHDGDTLILNNSLYDWNTEALNDTSGNLNPPSGEGRIWESKPDPPTAPLTRGAYMGYRVSCIAGYEAQPSAKDTVFLHQDEKDKLRQEYIDTHKSRVPARGEFTYDVDAQYFDASELRSDDYSPFIFNADFLKALDNTRSDYGHRMVVRRGYQSPNSLYTYKGIDSARSQCWENLPNSPHLFGLATDIDVEDQDHDNRLTDDWNEMAWTMRRNHIKPLNLVDSTMIHAEYDSLYEVPMVSIYISRPRVPVGLECYFYGQRIIRTISIEARVDTSLSPYVGNLRLYVDEVDSSGAHTHLNRPMNHHPQDSLINAERLNLLNGVVNTSYVDTCIWGGQYVFSATYQHGEEQFSGTDSMSIGIYRNNLPILFEYYDSTLCDWIRGSDSTFHSHAHFVEGRWIDRPYQIIERFYFLCDSVYPDSPDVRIRLNDLSLPMGGRFDVDGNWKQSKAHKSHRWGYEADIGFTDFDTTHYYRPLLYQACQEYGDRDPNEWEVWKNNGQIRRRYVAHLHAYLCRRWTQWYPPSE